MMLEYRLKKAEEYDKVKEAMLSLKLPTIDFDRIVAFNDYVTKQWYDDFLPTDRIEFAYSDWQIVWARLHDYLVFGRANLRSAIDILTAIDFYPRRILDLNGGIGLTTLQLAKAFPEATLTYNGHRGVMLQIADKLLGKRDIKFFSKEEWTTQKYDLVVAQDAFECYRDPFARLSDVALATKMLVTTSAFKSDGVGHYPTYNSIWGQLHNYYTRRKFNKVLMTSSFVKLWDAMAIKRPFHSYIDIYIQEKRAYKI